MTLGSLSRSSTDTHANDRPFRSAHCDNRVVFPYPEGATTETTGRGSRCRSWSIRNERTTVPGRSGGRRTFEVTSPSTDLSVRRDRPACSCTSLSPLLHLHQKRSAAPCSSEPATWSTPHEPTEGSGAQRTASRAWVQSR